MFFGKNDHGVVKHQGVIDAAFARAFAFVMDNGGFGEIIIFIS